MPLFDFDYAWDWDEFFLAIPGQVPVLGKWYNRGRGQWFPYWGMTEEQLAATALVGGAIKSTWGAAVYGGISLYETYSSARFIAYSARLASRYVAPVAVGYIGAHATHDVVSMSLGVTAHRVTELQTPGYSKATTADLKPWWMPLPVFVALYG